MRWPRWIPWVTKAAPPAGLSPPSNTRGWYPLIREPFTGAWQRNLETKAGDVLTFAAVYACVTLIAQDIAKLRIKLVEQDAEGIWQEVENPAYSPVLRKPNHFQTRIAFMESWMLSKLIHGNTYVIKERDSRGVVIRLYVLDPQRVRVLVAPDGSVWYALGADNLSQLEDAITVPASEIIHDKACTLYHPLVGISPVSACGLAAIQGAQIQNSSAQLFGNGAMPGGLLFVPPVEFPDEEARENLQRRWMEGFSGPNVGKVAVLASDWKYETAGVNATDAQLIEQLKWTAENVCMAYHVPPYKIGAATPPAYNNIEALNQEYYAQALQNPIESIEVLLDEGLGMRVGLGTELDLDDLMRMDTMTRATAAEHAIKSGMSPNEVRWRFYDLGPVKGGEFPYMQQQNWPLALLGTRPAAALAPPPSVPAPVPDTDADEDEEKVAATTKDVAAALRRALEVSA